MNSPTVLLAQELIQRTSITPEDAGCQNVLAQRLAKLNFTLTDLPFGEVQNLWARWGTEGPVFVFAGHTDVVPPGPVDKWQFDPFSGQIHDGYLYGRGAADMKSSIAAMVTACERFFIKHPQPKGSIAFLITSDEEGPSVDGTKRVVEYLQQKGEKIDWCLVGEASTQKILGDVIKVGRRGTLSGDLKIFGLQGHIAYPHKSINPIHKSLAPLLELTQTQWDEGNEFFEPTSFQFSNLNSGTGAENIIPGELRALFNFRYSSAVTAEQLQTRVESILQKYDIKYCLEWHHSGKPFLTQQGKFLQVVVNAIKKISGIEPELSTIGGTSDGRFIAEMQAEVVEVGPNNSSIHRIDEHIQIAELEQLSALYEAILEGCFVL